MDLKLKDVAELLNISESTVRRLLNKGKIPGYRLNRQYRFSRTEIEDWVMNQKLTFGDNDVEDDKEESTPMAGNMQFSLYRAMYRGEVIIDTQSTTKEEIICSTMKKMAKSFDLDAEVLSELFLDRESLMPTSLGQGIGVPHTRDFLLNTHFDVITVVFPFKAIEYGALDGIPVHSLFFLFACEDNRHLHLLAKLAHLSSTDKARQFLATKPSKERLLEYVKDWESSLHVYS